MEAVELEAGEAEVAQALDKYFANYMTERKRKIKHRRTTPKNGLLVPQPFFKKVKTPKIVAVPKLLKPERVLDEMEERVAKLEIEEARLEVERDKLEKRRKEIAARKTEMSEKEWAFSLKMINQELEANQYALDRVREELRTIREELAH